MIDFPLHNSSWQQTRENTKNDLIAIFESTKKWKIIHSKNVYHHIWRTYTFSSNKLQNNFNKLKMTKNIPPRVIPASKHLFSRQDGQFFLLSLSMVQSFLLAHRYLCFPINTSQSLTDKRTQHSASSHRGVPLHRLLNITLHPHLDPLWLRIEIYYRA